MELNKLLAAVRERPPDDVYLNEPADDDVLARMQADAMRHLGRAVPGEYELLLRVTNGVQINGAYFKSAEDLVPENIDVAMPEMIVLGNRGNVDHLVYDHRDQRYATINMGFRDERFAVFERFADLLVEVMRLEDVRLGRQLWRRRRQHYPPPVTRDTLKSGSTDRSVDLKADRPRQVATSTGP